MEIKTNENNGWYNREISITAPNAVINSYYAESYFEISCGCDTITINSAEKWLADARSNEAKYLGRYFLDEKSGALYHPVCVLTPECPRQLWCVVVNPAPAYSYKPNMHKMYFGPEDRYSYWLYYNPMYCKRVSHAYFTHMRELTQEEFDVAAKAAFTQMWEQVHDSFTLDNFKEKVTHYYDAVSHLA